MTNFIEQLEREVKTLREDYVDREMLLHFAKKKDWDGFAGILAYMDTCQRDMIWNIIEDADEDTYNKISEFF